MQSLQPERSGRVRGGRASLMLLGAFALYAGCERQSIDLLPDDGGASASAGSTAQGGSAPGASGTSGAAAVSGGGRGGSLLDGGWSDDCPPGTNCPDDPNFDCPPNVDACQRCDRDSDCDWPLHCAFNGRCVECVSDGDCDDPEASRCHPLAHHCVPYCDTENDTCPPDRPICDVAAKSCGQCLLPSHCPGMACIWGECVECTTDAECSDEAPFCRNFSCRPSP
jgi:hypothetical protein